MNTNISMFCFMELCIIYNIIDILIDILDLTMPIRNLLFTYYNDFCFLDNKESWILWLFFCIFLYILYLLYYQLLYLFLVFSVRVKNGII